MKFGIIFQHAYLGWLYLGISALVFTIMAIALLGISAIVQNRRHRDLEKEMEDLRENDANCTSRESEKGK